MDLTPETEPSPLSQAEEAKAASPEAKASPEPVDPELIHRVEALLFAAEEPRTVRWMASHLGVKGRDVRKVLNRLIRQYKKRQGALEVREVVRDLAYAEDFDASKAASEWSEAEMLAALDEGPEASDFGDEDSEDEASEAPQRKPRRSVPAYHLAVRHAYEPVIEKLLPPELSKPVLGTLSVVATRQPLLQSELIRIRGKRAYAHIKDLLVHRLIRRKPVEGTFSLSTTAEFSRQYSLDPRAREVAAELFQAPSRPKPGLDDETLAEYDDDPGDMSDLEAEIAKGPESETSPSSPEGSSSSEMKAVVGG